MKLWLHFTSIMRHIFKVVIGQAKKFQLQNNNSRKEDWVFR
jgi:hypothetical protein